MAITLRELLFQMSSKAHCSDKVIYLSHARLNSSHDRPFFFFSCFLGQSPNSNYTCLKLGTLSLFQFQPLFCIPLFFCLCILCRQRREFQWAVAVLSEWAFTSLFMKTLNVFVKMKEAPMLSLCLGNTEIIQSGKSLNYYYLVIVLLAIETIAYILNLHHTGIIVFFVCWLVGIYLSVCVHLSIFPTLNKTMAWFLIFQSSTVCNVRACLMPWSFTSRNQTLPFSTICSLTHTSHTRCLPLCADLRIQDWNTYNNPHAIHKRHRNIKIQ